jgi:hypothetical protein
MSLKSSCLHPVFGPVFTPLSPLWARSVKSKEVFLNLGMLELSNQCPRFEVIIVVVHVGAVKMYVTAVKALKTG